MESVLNATDVRKDWGHFIDQVVRERPQMVRRNRDMFLGISVEHARLLLSEYRFTLEIEQEADGSFTGSISQLDLAENAPSVQDLAYLLAESIVDYAQDFMRDFTLYSNAPNRRAHLPYVLHTIVQNDVSDVVALIDAKMV